MRPRRRFENCRTTIATVCDVFIYFAVAVFRGFWRFLAVFRDFGRLFMRPNSSKLGPHRSELIFSAWASGVRKLLQSKHQLSAPRPTDWQSVKPRIQLPLTI
jgi:hypothetical protein